MQPRLKAASVVIAGAARSHSVGGNAWGRPKCALTAAVQQRSVATTAAHGVRGTSSGGATGRPTLSAAYGGVNCPSCGGPLNPPPIKNLEYDRFLECKQCMKLFQSAVNVSTQAQENGAMDALPVPKQMHAYLSSFVIGQQRATRLLAVAVYNHFKRVSTCPRPVVTKTAQQPTAPNPGGNLLPPFDTMQHTNTHMGATPVRPAAAAQIMHGGVQSFTPPSPSKSTSVSMAEKITSFDKSSAPVRIDKSNILMIGPTGTGKTLLAQTVAECLDVPFTICDCTSLTAAGYVGEDVDTIVERLLAAANGDVEKAQRGIVFLDEVDKICAMSSSDSISGPDRKDVGGVAVQQALLRMVEGCVVDVGANRRQRDQPVPVDTTNVLFVISGAFTGMPKIVRRRRTSKTVGFSTGQRSADGDESTAMHSADDPFGLRTNTSSPLTPLQQVELENEENDRLIEQVEARDLISYGLIPEFVGRFPVIVPFKHVTQETLVTILTEPANSIVKQYQHQFAFDNVELTFTEEALRAIARKALRSRTGARSLRVVAESVLSDAMYEAPGSDIRRVHITEDVVDGKQPFIAERACADDSDDVADDGQWPRRTSASV